MLSVPGTGARPHLKVPAVLLFIFLSTALNKSCGLKKKISVSMSYIISKTFQGPVTKSFHSPDSVLRTWHMQALHQEWPLAFIQPFQVLPHPLGSCHYLPMKPPVVTPMSLPLLLPSVFHDCTKPSTTPAPAGLNHLF